SVCVVLVSVGVATFPGELVDELVPQARFIPTTSRPSWSEEDDWTSFHELLFAGGVDEVVGRPRSLFSNRLVLTDQRFVDPDTLDRFVVSHSFRGRDLRRAVFNGADLRKGDFTGAMLNGASFERAKLQNAQFGCANKLGADCTWLQGALLTN